LCLEKNQIAFQPSQDFTLGKVASGAHSVPQFMDHFDIEYSRALETLRDSDSQLKHHWPKYHSVSARYHHPPKLDGNMCMIHDQLIVETSSKQQATTNTCLEF
jgi:hypothetical protein